MIQGTMIVISHTCRGIYKNIAQLLVTVETCLNNTIDKTDLSDPFKTEECWRRTLCTRHQMVLI